MSRNSGGAGVIVGILLIVAGLAGGNLLLFAHALQQLEGGQPALPLVDQIWALHERLPNSLAYLGGLHGLAGIAALGLLLLSRRKPAAPVAATAAESAPAADPSATALQLLALLQAEGRLIDFLEEDIDLYGDAQVGAAVRSIHAGCRNALHERMRIERISSAEDGTEIEIPAGYDPATIRLTGNVHGQPPFRGTLQHGGWRAANIKLPQPAADLDASVLAPAEVEIP